jgi:ATP-dependent DNA helicase PIF1
LRIKQLNDCQTSALINLKSSDNIFLTGVAGSGKSFLIRHFLKSQDNQTFPVLASTGAAAILVGGRTFHSYFGLGIMQGGFDETVKRALKNKRLVKRIQKTKGVVIDEVSMLSGPTLRAAEFIARSALKKNLAWGGLKIITVGDFAQLPPVNRYGSLKEWAFLDHVWEASNFIPQVLKTVVRTKDAHFSEVLNQVRLGQVTPQVSDFLSSKVKAVSEDFDGTRLFPRREQAETYNLTRLERIKGNLSTSDTVFSGDQKFIEDLKRSSPIPNVLTLKIGALVMLRVNDPKTRWVNGSLGIIKNITPVALKIELFDGGVIEVEKVSFSLLNAEGKEVASALNFPVNLAYAATIHKAQGMTLDKIFVDLKNLWEPGQAYVALSRIKDPSGLFISDWSPSSIKTDPLVTKFNHSIWEYDFV